MTPLQSWIIVAVVIFVGAVLVWPALKQNYNSPPVNNAQQDSSQRSYTPEGTMEELVRAYNSRK